MHSRSDPYAFNQSHIHILNMLAGQAAIAIEQARLYGALQSAHDNMEKRVQELTRLNQQLQQEIQKRTHIETALADERHILRTLIDTLPDHIYIKDTESRFLNANLTVAHNVNVGTPDKLIGRTDFDFFPQSLAEEYYADEQAIIQSGDPLISKEERTIAATGQEIWISTTKVPLKNEMGDIIGIVGFRTRHYPTKAVRC